MRRALAILVLFGGCESPATSTFVLEGFAFHWQIRPHRINQIGAAIDGSAGSLTLQGGSWADGASASDAADREMSYAAVSSPGLLFLNGETPTLTLEGDPATAEHSVSIPTSLLPGATEFAVFLRGFELDTDVTHEDGYTVRGLGARVLNLQAADGLLTFQARIRIAAGAVPDRIQNLGGYGATGRVLYTVVGVLAGAVTTKTHGYTLSYPFGFNPDQPHATAAQQKVSIQGEPGHALGFAALMGFEFRLNPQTNFCPGRYMRDLSVRISGFQYDPASGVMKLKCDGYFSNSGPISWALTNEFQAWLVLVQATEGSIAHSSKTGASFPLP